MKYFLILLMVIGFYAASMAFFPSAWSPFTWTIPFTTFYLSWGIVGMMAVLYFGMKVSIN